VDLCSQVPLLPFYHFRPIFCICVKTWYLGCWAWHISLNSMISTSIHFPESGIISFFLLNNTLCVYTHLFFIHSLVIEHLQWFLCLAIVNNAVINMDVQISLLYVDLHSFRYMPKSGVVQRGHKVGLFLALLKNHHADFHNGWTNLHSHQQWMRGLFSHILSSICCCSFC
jgi:hypothetical protein